MHIQKIGHFDHVKILEEVQSLIAKVGIKEYDRIMLQSPIENADPFKWWAEGVTDEWGKMKIKDSTPSGHMFGDYTHPLFAEAQLINHYMNKFQLFRTRVIKMGSRSCLSYHQDKQRRIHFPLVTNEKCFMVIEGKTYWLRPGRIYLVNTKKTHTVINGNRVKEPFDRIHIVGCLKE